MNEGKPQSVPVRPYGLVPKPGLGLASEPEVEPARASAADIQGLLRHALKERDGYAAEAQRLNDALARHAAVVDAAMNLVSAWDHGDVRGRIAAKEKFIESVDAFVEQGGF